MLMMVLPTGLPGSGRGETVTDSLLAPGTTDQLDGGMMADPFCTPVSGVEDGPK